MKNARSKDSPGGTSHVSRSVLEQAFLVLLLALGMWRFHASEIQSGWDSVRGDRGDARFCAFILENEWKSLKGDASFTSPPMFFPLKGTLGYSETFLALLPPYALFRSLALDPWTSFQGVGVICDLLAFLFAYGFFRRGLGAGRLSAGLGAAFFAFNNARFQQTMHLQSQAGFLLPASAWLLANVWLRFSPPVSRFKDYTLVFLAGLSLALPLLTCFFIGWFFGVGLGLFITALLFTPSARKTLLVPLRDPETQKLLLAGIVLPIGFFLGIYGSSLNGTTGRSYADFLSLMPTIGSWFWMGPEHFLWGVLGPNLGMTEPSVAEFELRMGWGVLAGGFILFSGIASWFLAARKSQTLLPRLCAILLILFFLAVTRWGSWSPWIWVFDHVPGASAIRAVGRVHLVLALPAAILIAWGWEHLEAIAIRLKGRSKNLALVGLGLFIVLAVSEQGAAPPPSSGFSASRERAYLEQLSSRIPKDAVAFYIAPSPDLPARSDELSLDAMWAAHLSGVPTLNGYSGVNPPGWDLLGLKRPDYRDRVSQWINKSGIKGKVAEINIGR